METKNEQLSYVPMYKSYIDSVAKLSPEDRLTIYEAIFEYGFNGIEPTFDNPYLEMGWSLVKPNLDNNISRVKANQENGKKGGRPKKETITDTLPTQVKETIQPEPKVAKNEEKPSKKELFDYSEECMKEFNGTESLFGEVNAKINAGAIQTMIEVKSEFESQFNVKQKSNKSTRITLIEQLDKIKKLYSKKDHKCEQKIKWFLEDIKDFNYIYMDELPNGVKEFFKLEEKTDEGCITHQPLLTLN